ncbi:DUF2147 domain-containing protein [Geomonas sp.]|uniref:DUF2147 domain-containing protein n=1 Tax=Geomonas sp. TaxID=2651584 RepID=UPI002B46BE80|nr:DUF2147 domain-containing protein [Geomonas sp.]HJV34468.1 DUF2147 domain-containing protein [Geomonas sp.]
MINRLANLGILVAALVVILGLSTVSAQPLAPDAIVGTWWSPQKDARIELYKSGQKLMGKIAWVIPERRDDLDVNNPDKAQRDKKIVGSIIFKDFIFEGGKWTHGKVYDPDSGKTYSASMRLVDSNTLSIHGYILVPLLGRSEIFTRFSELRAPCGN